MFKNNILEENMRIIFIVILTHIMSYEEELESRTCVYHKGKDILDIPEYLISIVPEYNFYLKHNTDGFADTVLYCEDKSQL